MSLRSGLRFLWKGLKVGYLTGGIWDLPRFFKKEVREIVRREGLSAHTLYSIYAHLHGERIAFKDPFRSLTFLQARDEIHSLAVGFYELGVRKGDRVILAMENRVEYLITLFALANLTASAVHASFRLTPEEFRHILSHSGARFVVGGERSLSSLQELRKTGFPFTHISLGEGGDVRYEDLLKKGKISSSLPREGRGGRRNALNFVYTSGTTGIPRAAYRDFRSVSLPDILGFLERVPFRAKENHLVVAPLYHSAPQAFAYMHCALGSTLFLLPDFDPSLFWRVLQEEKITSVFLVPTMVYRILKNAPTPLPNLSSFRVLLVGAAPFPHPLREKAMKVFGEEKVFEFYGATELGWVTVISGKEMKKKIGSVGRPVPGTTVKIFNEEGKELPPGEVGLIYAKNGITMVEYDRDPEESSRIRRGDFLTVEDLGYLDPDGYLYLQGRKKDMIISGGVNIYPQEIERVLLQHPSVKDIAVLGVPDPEWGEKVVAVVVPEGSPPLPEELSEYAKKSLAGFKIPREWHFWEELPRNPTGKVLKREIQKALSLNRGS